MFARKYICPAMKRNLVVTSILLLLTAGFSAMGQSTYPANGIYLTFESFRKGVPDLKAEMLYKDNKKETAASGIRLWFNQEKKWYQTVADSVVDLGEMPVWGFFENGTAYILINGKFHKVILLGQISYLLESYPIIRDHMSPVVTESKSESVYRLLDMKTGKIEIGRAHV